jgi:glycosyltransferase involved in cell wall biosynthesis
MGNQTGMLSIVIPAYNEEDGIKEIMDRTLAVAPALAEVGIDQMELLVVDDGSSDATAAIVSATPGATLIQHARNGGYGAALKTGFAAAKGEWIGFLDADGTYPPEYFPALVKSAKEQDADIVIGSRMAGEASEMPAMRRIGNLIFARLVNIISRSKITDSASGMRIFRNTALPMLYPLPDGLNLTPVMSTRALHEHLKMVEVPIPYSERQGRSKLSVVRDGYRFGQSIMWTALNYNPARPFGLVGMGMFFTALFVGLVLVVARLLGIQSVGAIAAFALYAAVVLAVAGVSLISLGFSFNYFVALFHKSPVRQGLWGKPFFNVRWEQHFGWIGGIIFATGVIIGLVSMVLALNGLSLTELWIYYLAAACLVLIGIQLMVSAIQVNVLDALRVREQLADADLRGKETRKPTQATATETNNTVQLTN